MNKETMAESFRVLAKVADHRLRQNQHRTDFRGKEVTYVINNLGLYNIFFENQFGQNIVAVAQIKLKNINPFGSKYCFPYTADTSILNAELIKQTYFEDITNNDLANNICPEISEEEQHAEISSYIEFVRDFANTLIVSQCMEFYFAMFSEQDVEGVAESFTQMHDTLRQELD
ncbi:MAG: hypothetical protein ACW99F_00470 [Candidatus Hodarchaeales archaeon]|jgi:hypothetical protein